MSPSAAVLSKADRYLTEGRVAVSRLTTEEGHFRVAGSGPEPYKVAFRGDWICNCPAQVMPCAHIVACQKISTFEAVRGLMFNDIDLSEM